MTPNPGKVAVGMCRQLFFQINIYELVICYGLRVSFRLWFSYDFKYGFVMVLDMVLVFATR